jgi:hypothetical protein
MASPTVAGQSLNWATSPAVNFIRLHPSGSRFLLCEAEDMKSCFAEFYRKRQSDA